MGGGVMNRLNGYFHFAQNYRKYDFIINLSYYF